LHGRRHAAVAAHELALEASFCCLIVDSAHHGAQLRLQTASVAGSGRAQDVAWQQQRNCVSI
jgi:hypothetical protein